MQEGRIVEGNVLDDVNSGCPTRKPKLDNKTTNVWLRFDSWQCSSPPPATADVSLITITPWASYYSDESCGGRLLVLSDCTHDTRLPSSCTCGLETWTYRLNENSWSLIEDKNPNGHPKQLDRRGKLVTLCKSTVFYISPSQSRQKTVSIFDGQEEIWSKKSVSGTYPLLTAYYNGFYALIDHRSMFSSSCECKYAIIAVSYQADVIVIWKLSCSDERGNYHWSIMKNKYNNSQQSAIQMIYPKELLLSTMCAATEESFLLAMSNSGLWKYDLYDNLWYHLNSSIMANSSSIRRCNSAFYFRIAKYYVLLCKEFYELVIYSLDNNAWSFASWSYVRSNFIDLNQISNIVLTTDSSSVLVYSGVIPKCNQLLWELDNVGSHWKRTEISGPLLSPPMTENVFPYSVVHLGNKFYITLDNMVSNKCSISLWELNLPTMSWTLLKTTISDRNAKECSHSQLFLAESVVLHYSLHLIFFNGGRFWRDFTIVGHDTKNLSWTLNAFLNDGNSHRYRDYTVTALNKSTFLVYSVVKKDNNRYSCGLWAASLMSRHSSSLQWRLLENHCLVLNTTAFNPILYYQLFVIQNVYILMGWTFDFPNCPFNVWQYYVVNRSWTQGDNSIVQNKCKEAVASSVGSQIAVAFTFELWLYNTKSMSWFLHSRLELDYKLKFLFFWRGKLFLLDQDLTGLSYMNLVCPPGYSSPDIQQIQCISCLEGFYSTGNGETSCTPCPPGLTTVSSQSTSKFNCSICKDNSCRNGICRVLLENGLPRPYCKCSFGFSGDNCQDPKYILVLLGVTAAVGLAGYGVVRLVAYWKHKRKQERSLVHHVEELTSAWQISYDEVTPIQLIGAGGYGEVYRCKYRDLFVAMKILRLPATDSIMLEFEREIKFMQTVRHPNIVLFLGAGHTRDGSPFLVSEFVSRGSLRSLLEDTNITMTTAMQLKFCQDVSRGMRFLHGLTPPRVHGDLKSDNLLISETDTIKIADFGLAKQISSDVTKNRNVRRRVQETRPRSSVILPLVEFHNHESPHALGASRWRPPELAKPTAKTNYRTSADVYRLTVTLIFICTSV
jgi:hypothetical protein